MNNIHDLAKKMMLQDCNNKIDNVIYISNYLSQYSHVNSFLIPKKYKEHIQNELDKLDTPLIYEFAETPKTQENSDVILNIINMGVVQRENWLKEMEKWK